MRNPDGLASPPSGSEKTTRVAIAANTRRAWFGNVVANAQTQIAYPTVTAADKLKGCLRSIGTDGDSEQIYVGVQEGTVYAYSPPLVASGITK
jgi:hypothetical protein